ncbi:MAG: PA14 domain-containing protein [Phycisphaerae bacterium]|nr:PA14 domain-containing protein [Phycisphaerae bacterium]
MSKKFICLTAVGLMLAIAGSAGAQVGKGKILFEYWDNIGGGTAITDLTNNALYPNKPTSSEWRDSFESPVNRADNYGMRAQALLTPPADGDYTFYIATDDAGELWLSTDATPANAKKIAFVAGWAGANDWQNANEKANQKSAAITLKGGQNYYIMGLEKEGGGGDNLDVGWTGPVIGTAIKVIAGQYCTAIIRDPEPLFKASKPDPANGKTEVTNPLFTWTPGVTTVSNEVYCGTNPTPGAAEFMGPWPSVSPTSAMFFYIAGLTPGATYYWRVDEVDAAGAKITGDVWSFTAQPLEAHNPSPVDGALWRKTNLTVSWTAGQGAVSHKVYGGTDKAAIAAGDAGALLATVAEAKLDASALLQPATTYYWRVDEVDSTGKVSAGPVWSFSTIDPAGGAIAEYFNNINLSGQPAVVKVVPNVDFSWPDGTVMGTNSPDPAINTNNFSARFTAQLNVPVSGKYKLYDASDDGARLFLNGTQITNGWVNRGETEDASAELDLVAGQSYVLVMEYYEATGGAAARLRWSGPGIAKEIIPQGALQLPQVAISPNPGNNAVEVADNAVMIFTPGPKSLVNTMYFGTDKAKVTAGDASVALPPTAEAKYVPAAPLTWNTTYYWRVDGMGADGSTIAGLVWSFTTANWIVVNAGQVALSYDNTQAPYTSQVALDVPADLTKNGVTDLFMQFQGLVADFVDKGNNAFTIRAAGADIYNTTDEFRYVYQTLTGDGSITVRVDSLTLTNAWVKAGVMIRESLNPVVKSVHTIISGSNGFEFQYRAAAGGNTTQFNTTSGTPALPQWVRLTRKGNTFTGESSADGKTWTKITVGTSTSVQDLVMTGTVYIGMAVTSHVAGTLTTAELSNVDVTGATGPWQVKAIAGTHATNSASPLYATIEDKAGKIASVTFPDPAATQITQAWTWKIPLSAFAGVDLKNAAKLYLGAGDLVNPAPDGSGVVTFSNIRVVLPIAVVGGADVTQPGDNVLGVPNNGNWPAAEYPALVIDNKTSTKFLHFSGKTDPVGFQVEPLVGPTVVTGLTFTTANDSDNRDPVKYELSGSNDSITGPWTLIASGDIVDFAGATAWPRLTKGTTPIAFANAVAYKYYQVMFPAIRNPATANSMQIAEVELLALSKPKVVWVSFHGADDTPSNGAKGVGFTQAVDKPYTDLLKANGYDVVRYVQNNNPNLAMLNAADLVIVSRSCASTSFQNAAAGLWNSVTAPMILTNGYLTRKARLGFMTGSTLPDITGDIKLRAMDPTHPIFAGISLTDCTTTNAFAGLAVYPTDGTKAAGISIVTEPPVAGGTVLATVSATSAATGPAGAMVIGEWQAGAQVVHDGGAGTDTLGGHRLVFLTGARENGGKSSETAGQYDLTADGAKMFLNAVQYMLQ